MAPALPVVDLRSDTVTRPSAAMRRAIAEAEVGDDVLGDDPTVRTLQDRIAKLLGKEAALFFPSGTQANQTAILLHAEAGTEVICEAGAHIYHYEMGAPSAWAGVQLRPVPTPDGVLTADRVRAHVRPPSPHLLRTAAIMVENTHNSAGGKVIPLDALRGVRKVADEHGLPVHLDGARLWNASAASGVPLAEYAACADTVMVSFSKGLGCPIGSALAGPRALIERAWTTRKRLGGGMRQVGILAAAALYALDHNLARLEEDHRRAKRLAELANDVDGLEAAEPDSNIVMIDLGIPGLDADAALRRLAELGVLVVPFGPTRLRAVTHLDVDDAGIERAGHALRDLAGR
ncbi:MAG: threonine aldolase family protein [Gemmatimonadota bacterium]